MNLKDLQKKVAEVLGVSNSQSEIAFEIFAEKVYESLYEGITLKVPRIGFFQLKSVDKKSGQNRPVIFTPLSIDFSHDSHNLYLTFEVQPKTKDSHELDSNVFSIGVGKPLLPLTIDDLPNSETSFAVLKKSIEERAKELIAESDQIPNFNIFEDYYKFPDNAAPEQETHTVLTDLTSDIDFLKQPEKSFDLRPEEDFKILSTLIEETSEPVEQPLEKELKQIPVEDSDYIKKDVEPENVTTSGLAEENPPEEILDSEGKSSETLLAELLSDHSLEVHKKEEIENPEVKNENEEEIINTIDASAFVGKVESPWETQTPAQPVEHAGEIDSAEKENLSLPEEEFIEEHYADEQKEEFVHEEKIPGYKSGAKEEPEEDLELREELIDSEKQTGEKIEWNWGDELREEFGLGHLESEEANYEMVDETKTGEKTALEHESEEEKDSIRDLFAQLEKTLEHDRAFLDEDFYEEKKSSTHTKIPEHKHNFKNDDKVYLEYSSSPSKYEFVPVKTSEEERRGRMAISLAEEPNDYFERRQHNAGDGSRKPAVRRLRREGSASKLYLLYIAILAVLGAAVYLVIRNGSQQAESTVRSISQNNISQTQIDSIRTAIENAPDSSKYLLDESGDFPLSATPPVPVKNQRGIEKLPPEIKALNSKKLTASSKQPGETKEDLYKAPKTDTRIDNSIYYDGKSYNFQASSWRNKTTAEQEVQRLRSLGLQAYLVEAYLPQKGGTWYRVRIGPFNSEKETRQFMSENNFK